MFRWNLLSYLGYQLSRVQILLLIFELNKLNILLGNKENVFTELLNSVAFNWAIYLKLLAGEFETIRKSLD